MITVNYICDRCGTYFDADDLVQIDMSCIGRNELIILMTSAQAVPQSSLLNLWKRRLVMVLLIIEIILFTLLCFSTGVLYEDMRRDDDDEKSKMP